MNSPSALRAKDDANGLQVQECQVKQFAFNRFLYQMVGSDWRWTDKLSWSDDQWRSYAEGDDRLTWVAWFKGSPAGYYELHFQEHGAVEVSNFGLLTPFIGKGFGGYLLTHAIRSAWESGASRVWLHTCTYDHPNALANYEARGMKRYRTETKD
jgi:GNAT superfamily N-acetyltransferase